MLYVNKNAVIVDSKCLSILGNYILKQRYCIPRKSLLAPHYNNIIIVSC